MKRNRKSGKTRVRPVPLFKRKRKNLKRRLRRLTNRVCKLSRAEKAPLMTLVFLKDGCLHIEGSTKLADSLKMSICIKTLMANLTQDTDTNEAEQKGAEEAVVDFCHIDVSINWEDVCSIGMLRKAYSMIVPKKENQKYPSYRPENMPPFWPETVPFVSHSKTSESGGRIINARKMREVMKNFAQYCLEKKAEGWKVVNEVEDQAESGERKRKKEEEDEERTKENEEQRKQRRKEEEYQERERAEKENEEQRKQKRKEEEYQERERTEKENEEQRKQKRKEEEYQERERTEKENEEQRKQKRKEEEYQERERAEKENEEQRKQKRKEEEYQERERAEKENEEQRKQKRKEEEYQERERAENRFIEQYLTTSGFSTRSFWTKTREIFVGSELLTKADMDTLRGSNWLIDKVMNAYMSVLQQEHNLGAKEHIYVFPSYIAAIWDRQRTPLICSKVKLAPFTWLFMPVNVNENHWILLAANIPAMEVSILDSLGGKHPKVLKSWRKYMRTRSSLVGELFGSWSNGSICSGRQQDTHSCGPFVLMNALALCKGFQPADLSTRSARAMRMHAYEKLIGHAEHVRRNGEKCDMPGCVEPNEKKKLACDCCGRWCHYACVHVHQRCKDGFICPVSLSKMKWIFYIDLLLVHHGFTIFHCYTP